MFDIGWSELFLIAVVALVAIGPKDLPKMMLMLGKLARQARGVAHDLQRQWHQLSYEAEVAERSGEAEKPAEKKEDFCNKF